MQRIIAILLMLLFYQFGISQNGISSAFRDFTNDSIAPAFNKELIINIKDSRVAGYAFIANGETRKETVILLHGLPGNDNQFDLAQSLRRTGRNVIHFNYRGSWGSEGEFSYSNSLEDVDEIINYLVNVEVADKLRIDTSKFTLLGRSYGGGISLIAGGKNERVKKIIAISSMNAGSLSHPIQNRSKYNLWIEYLEKQVMLKMEPTLFMEDIYKYEEEYDVVTYKELISTKKTLVIEDNLKNYNWINQLENVDFKKLDSDHNFISNRIEVINMIVEWLDSE